MSIESTLERLAISAERSELLLAKILTALEDMDVAAAPAPTPAAEPAPAPTKATAVVAPIPTPTPPFEVPVPAHTPAAELKACPFKDAKEMLDYCMNKYRTLGPVKGGMIQSILIEMGISNINAIPVDRFNEFYTKVEGII